MTTTPRDYMFVRGNFQKRWAVVSAILFLASLVSAQSITSIDPSQGKVNDDVTISGASLGKKSVSGLFLSDDKKDYKADVVSQAEDKVVIKVPNVKPGVYNVSVQTGDRIIILPIRFTVAE